ncbi:sigma-70 family RNA polymerase sigma factor [Pyxidicoccus fallax]|uniref:Sigma-70 family RNA polymerase sigma factor n=1 Tax=Pyxidicoccus fallax TaxID=394095 RepID=A0A848LTU1_9BACT|nr:sigma-70 family RNA polymerase sigma factor [Pyxidicoccus fallax]NMO21397.1 sigma-70 family RNA polymerase sigma factor [Pyxidicoccus fallax]NPC85518.1 sigma-70 family RNA polymerase sigma factor [Pyxidicoccus fallax]
MEWDDDNLRRFREGTPDVLAAVYREHAEGLARMLRAAAWRGGVFSHLKSAMELENTLLETFARAFEPRTRAAYDGTRPYGHFLMGIARNVLLEQTRNRELAVGLEPFEQKGEVVEDGPGLAQLLEDREVEALVAGFKDGLNDEERRLFELRFGEGLPQETAASRMGLTRIQVRRREHGIKTRLLGFLQARGYLEGLESRGWSFFRRRGES